MRKSIITCVVAALTLCVIAVQPSAANTLRIGFSGDVCGMDPYASSTSFTLGFLSHIYEPLVRYNRDLKIEPALATSWKIIEPTVWRIKLREGVKFHNGNHFNADDVDSY